MSFREATAQRITASKSSSLTCKSQRPSESPSHSPAQRVSFAPSTDHSGGGDGAPSSKDRKQPDFFQRSLESPLGPASLCPLSPIHRISFVSPTDHSGEATERPPRKTERGPDSSALLVRLRLAQRVSLPLSRPPRLFCPPDG